MAISWGSKSYGSGSNWFQLGIDVSWEGISHGETVATATVKYYGRVRWKYADHPTIRLYGGSINDTFSFDNHHGTNGSNTPDEFLITTRTYNYTYPSNSYGSSPSRRTFSAEITGGTYNGASPDVTVKSKVPVRPYAKPADPGGAMWQYVSDSRANITWTNHATAGAPYDSIEVWRYRWVKNSREYDGGRKVATLPGRADSWTDPGLAPDNIYYWTVRASNDVGKSGWSGNGMSTSMNTTPDGPSNVKARVTGSGGGSILVTWSNETYHFHQVVYDVQRYDGSTWSTIDTTDSYATSWTDTAPLAGTNQYRLRSRVTAGNELHSGWVESNSVSTIVAPLAPTILRPLAGGLADLDEPFTLSWEYHDGGDGAEQGHFDIDVSSDNGQTWTKLVLDRASSAQEYTIPGGTLANGNTTYLWRVRTSGIPSGGYGPWSENGALTGANKPVVTITEPQDPYLSGNLTLSWDYVQEDGLTQHSCVVTLYRSDGVTVVEGYTLSTEQTVDFEHYLQDGETYIVRVWTDPYTGFPSYQTQTFLEFTVELPRPARVGTKITYDPCSGQAQLDLSAGSALPEKSYTNMIVNPAFAPGSGKVTVHTNRIANPNFADGVGGWNADGVTIAPYTGPQVPHGMSCTPDGSKDDSRVWVGSDVGGGMNGFVAGGSATIMARFTIPHDLQGPFNSKPTGLIFFWSTDGSTYKHTNFPISSTDAGQYEAVAHVSVPSDAVAAFARFQIASANTSDQVIIDRTLISNSNVPQYFDGDTGELGQYNLETAWTGTQGSSTSVMQGTAIPRWKTQGGAIAWSDGDKGAFIQCPTSPGTGTFFLVSQFMPNDDGPLTWSMSIENESDSAGEIHLHTDYRSGGPSLGDADGSEALPGDKSTLYAWPTVRPNPTGNTVNFGIRTNGVGWTETGVYHVTEPMAAQGNALPPYFDGSMPNGTMANETGVWDYQWTGAADASPSLAIRYAEAPVTAVKVQRSVDDGDTWAVVADNLPLPTTLIDPLVDIAGENVYKITGMTAEPAYGDNPLIYLWTPTGNVGHEFNNERPEDPNPWPMSYRDPGRQWLFITWGDGWQNQVRARWDLNVAETRTRARSVRQYVGHTLPGALAGQQRTRTFAVQATGLFDGPGCAIPDDGGDCGNIWLGKDSGPDEWRDLADNSTIVCLRDYTGRRIFGTITSEMTLAITRFDVVSVGFTITETNYKEDGAL